MKIILITGASSGIGFEAALSLKRQGHKVYGSVRDQKSAQKLRKSGIIPLELDVTEESQCRQAVDTIIKNDNRIDVLINNAGYGLFGPVEEIAMDEAKHQFDVNVFGMAALSQMVLPFMRKQRSGRIINTSSVGGRMVSFMGAWYHASKYAVEAFSDALRMETSDFGIDIVLIEPGGTRTKWWETAAKNLKDSSKGSAYEKTAEKTAKSMIKLYNNKRMSNPSVIAAAITQAVHARKPKTRYVIGFGGRSLLLLHWILPDRCYDWIVKKAM